MKSECIIWECVECGKGFDIDVTFPIAAQPFGPVERSHDGSAAEFSCLQCPDCGVEADGADVLDLASDYANDYDDRSDDI